jgi:putative NADH-flavin reductase
MNIIVFGANGGVGRCLIERALSEGHTVTAAVRNPAAVDAAQEGLRVMSCDIRDADSVARGIAGQDAVFCTVGADIRGRTDLYSTAARTIVQGMRSQRVRRLVFLSNFGVLGETATDIRGAVLLFLAKRVLRHTLDDHRRALAEIQDHVPEWIAVRPLPLTNGASTGRYRIAVDGIPAKGTHIARADVADFMLRQATNHDYLRKAPALAY